MSIRLYISESSDRRIVSVAEFECRSTARKPRIRIYDAFGGGEVVADHQQSEAASFKQNNESAIECFERSLGSVLRIARWGRVEHDCEMKQTGPRLVYRMNSRARHSLVASGTAFSPTRSADRVMVRGGLANHLEKNSALSADVVERAMRRLKDDPSPWQSDDQIENAFSTESLGVLYRRTHSFYALTSVLRSRIGRRHMAVGSRQSVSLVSARRNNAARCTLRFAATPSFQKRLDRFNALSQGGTCPIQHLEIEVTMNITIDTLLDVLVGRATPQQGSAVAAEIADSKSLLHASLLEVETVAQASRQALPDDHVKPLLPEGEASPSRFDRARRLASEMAGHPQTLVINEFLEWLGGDASKKAKVSSSLQAADSELSQLLDAITSGSPNTADIENARRVARNVPSPSAAAVLPEAAEDGQDLS